MPFDRAEARAAALERWGRTHDRATATLAARTAFLARFADQADPEHRLDPSERQQAAQRLMTAYMIRMARKRELKRRQLPGAQR